MKKTIKYIGFYDLPDGNRVYNLAAINKMNYIVNAMIEAGYRVDIISASWISDDNSPYGKSKTIAMDKDKKIIYGPSWGSKNKFSKYINIFISQIWLIYYLLRYTNKNENILAYHVQWLAIPIYLTKLIKKYNLILEVEEIYSQVWTESKKFAFLERILFKNSDKFIFVSDLLKDKFEIQDRDFTILYGNYLTYEGNLLQRKENKKIKLIYAGSIDSVKGGAINAVDSLRYLSNDYELFILGQGKKQDVQNLREKIQEVNNEKGEVICKYLGTKHGKEYSEFLSTCDVALNPQFTGDYMATAFPSKIISYLSHNLRVVTTEITSVKNSSLSDLLYFSRSDKPKDIATAIKMINLNTYYNSIEKINALHNKFVNDLLYLLD